MDTTLPKRKSSWPRGIGSGFEFTIYLYTLPGLPEIIDIGKPWRWISRP